MSCKLRMGVKCFRNGGKTPGHQGNGQHSTFNKDSSRKIKKRGMGTTLPLYHTKSSQMHNMTLLASMKRVHDPLYPTSYIIGIAIAVAWHDSCQLCKIVWSIKYIKY